MKNYRVVLTGLSPLFFHRDNLVFSEKVREWQKDPANKEWSVAGDDRSPAWTWIGCVYHNGSSFGLPAENFMTALREGGAKVKHLTSKRSNETYKKQTQAGIVVSTSHMQLLVPASGGKWKEVPVEPFQELIGNREFSQHLDTAERHGFELDVRRAKIGQSKHIRVRPRFDRWMVVGEISVIDEELTGVTEKVLQLILEQSGAMVGVGDWRPSSPKSSGSNGKFMAEVLAI